MEQKEYDQLAKLALSHYTGSFPSVTFYAKETSTVYKIVDSDGEEYALKLYEEESGEEIDSQIEVFLLEEIKRRSSIPVAQVIDNQAGEKITYIKDSHSSSTRRAILTRWLKGQDFKEVESEEEFVKLGKLVGELHIILKGVHLPSGLIPKKWDTVFYFRNEGPNYRKKSTRNLVNEEFREVMDLAIPKLNHELSRIYLQEEAHLLHGDLNPWNIKSNEGKLSLLDFEDAIHGPSIQELAIMLYYYRDHPTFPFELVKSCISEGYRNIHPIGELIDKDIEILMTARLVNFLNYVLLLDEDYREFIDKGVSRLRLFLKAI